MSVGENRSWGPCVDCIRYRNDERDKEIHGVDRCEAHYRRHLRRRKRESGDDAAGIVTERHITQELQAHQFLAERFQKFLHVLNHEKITLIVPPEMIQELRLLINPLQVRSERIAVPRSLPTTTLLDLEQGDMSPEISEVTVTLGSLAMAREARKRELAETYTHMREQQALAFEIIKAGFDELSTREKYKDGEAFKRLTLAVQMLKSLLAQPKTVSDADQLSEGIDEDVPDEDIPENTEK
jgi:hypothetical protein